MLNARIFSLRIFPDKDSVNVVVSGLEPLDRDARSDVGEKIESATKSQVE